MGVRKYKPSSPGRRFQTVSDFAEITTTTPEKSLLEPLPDGLLRAETIDNGFLKKSPDDPTILQPRTESAQA